jgi:hypothetical protein
MCSHALAYRTKEDLLGEANTTEKAMENFDNFVDIEKKHFRYGL